MKCTRADEEVGQKAINKGASQEETNEECSKPIWILHMDGVSNSIERRAGLILTSPKGVVVEMHSDLS